MSEVSAGSAADPTAVEQRRLGLAASLAVAALGVFFAIRANGGDAYRGPARTDDLPYGDLVTLDASGGVVFAILGVLGAAATWVGRRELLLATSAAWAVLAAVCFAVAVTSSNLLGAARPGTAAVASAVALILGLPALVRADGPHRAVDGRTPPRRARRHRGER